jgi:hypothetical protein
VDRAVTTAQLDLLALVPECVLPGCKGQVDEVGQPCDGCVAVFAELPGGWALRSVDAPPMTAAAIADRDGAVRDAYRQQQLVVLEQPTDDREWKANQLCWICDERRRCALVDHHGWEKRWECRSCQEIE